MDKPSLGLHLLDGNIAVCRLAPKDPVPEWAFAAGPLCSVTRTAEELSVVCGEGRVPFGVRCEKGWRALKVQGPLDFGLTGILDALTDPLARAGISIFAISTYDTDYLMIREASLEAAVQVLSSSGHRIQVS
jgi:uncharacterized protein